MFSTFIGIITPFIYSKYQTVLVQKKDIISINPQFNNGIKRTLQFTAQPKVAAPPLYRIIK